MFEPQSDFDVNLQIRSDNGTECTVNAYNKYCAYSAHSNDVYFGTGEESVLVRRLSVATYNAYVAPSRPYTYNCAAGENYLINSRYYHAQLQNNLNMNMSNFNWNWEQFKTTKPLYNLGICSQTFFNNPRFDVSQSSYTALSKCAEVESAAAASVPKRVINVNGVPVLIPIFFPTNTSGSPLPPNSTLNINGTVLENNTYTVTNGPCNSTITNITYSNSTLFASVIYFNITNVSVCSNCTNITDNFYGNVSTPYGQTQQP